MNFIKLIVYLILITAITIVGTDTYAYDAAGNMVSEVRAGQTIAYGYDGFNRLVSITNAAGTTSYVYGDGYERVQKRLPGGKSVTYFGELAEVDETGAWTDYLFLGGQRVATVQGGAIYYNVGDHLGSASLELDGSGAVVQKLDYLPFGSERVNVKSGAFETRFTFTDQERDVESGLLYYGARYYHPTIGRFTQPDPVAIANINRKEFQLALANPQLLNPYSYVGNNPIKNTDTEGEFIDTIIDVGFIAYDLYNIGKALQQGQSIKGELASLGLDIGGALLPGVTGLGMMARVANKADDVVDAVKIADKAVDTAKATVKGTGKASDTVKLLGTRRDNLLQSTKDGKLKKIIKNLYKEGATVGDGGTADAVRNEILTGKPTKGTFHFQKAQESINALKKVLKDKNLSNYDRQTANSLLNDLRDALSKKGGGKP